MQTCPFGDLEGLKIAAEMEKRGGEFYRLAAKVSRSQEAKELLTSLAADEAVHLREFQRLYEKAESENRSPYVPERAAYLSAMAAEIAFPEGVVGAADKLGSPKAILEHAIQSEQDSIRFYTELTKTSGCEPMVSVFEDIIRQETGHLHRLQKMLSEL